MQYPVKEPLKHDGQDYAPGDAVEMDAKAAKPLLALGVLGPAAKAAKTTPEDKPGADAGQTGGEEGK